MNKHAVYIFILIFGHLSEGGAQFIDDEKDSLVFWQNGLIKLKPGLYNLSVDRETISDKDLYILADNKLSVFIDNKLNESGFKIRLTHSDFNPVWKKKYLVTLYSDEREVDPVVFLVYEKTGEKEYFERSERVESGFNNFIRFFVFFILAGFTVIKVNLGKDIVEYFRIGFIFSSKNRDENIFKSKLSSLANILFLLFISWIAGFIITVALYRVEITDENFWTLIWTWQKWSGVSLMMLILKITVIRFFAYMFNAYEFYPFHIFNFLRLTLIFLLVITVGMLGILWVGNSQFSFIWIFFILIILFVIRSFILFLKLINELRFKFFHLFSYLCGTELIPFFWIYFMIQEFVI